MTRTLSDSDGSFAYSGSFHPTKRLKIRCSSPVRQEKKVVSSSLLQKGCSSENKHLSTVQKACRSLYEVIRKLKDENSRPVCKIFLHLPCSKTYPDYYQIISHPICLKDIKDNIERCIYESIEAMENDVNLMVSNAQQYNIPQSQVYEDASCIKKVFYKEVQKQKSLLQRDLDIFDNSLSRSFGGYGIGDFVYIQRPTKNHKEISMIEKIYQSESGERLISGVWFIPSFEKKGREHEVFVGKKFKELPFGYIMGKCEVMTIGDFSLYEPLDVDSEDTFFCEYHFNSSSNTFHAIKDWEKAIGGVRREFPPTLVALDSPRTPNPAHLDSYCMLNAENEMENGEVKHAPSKISLRLPRTLPSSPQAKSLKLTFSYPSSPKLSKQDPLSPKSVNKPKINLKITPAHMQKVTIKLPKSTLPTSTLFENKEHHDKNAEINEITEYHSLTESLLNSSNKAQQEENIPKKQSVNVSSLRKKGHSGIAFKESPARELSNHSSEESSDVEVEVSSPKVEPQPLLSSFIEKESSLTTFSDALLDSHTNSSNFENFDNPAPSLSPMPTSSPVPVLWLIDGLALEATIPKHPFRFEVNRPSDIYASSLTVPSDLQKVEFNLLLNPDIPFHQLRFAVYQNMKKLLPSEPIPVPEEIPTPLCAKYETSLHSGLNVLEAWVTFKRSPSQETELPSCKKEKSSDVGEKANDITQQFFIFLFKPS